MNSAPIENVIVVRRLGGVASMAACHKGLLEDVASYSEKTLTIEDDGSHEWNDTHTPLYHATDDGFVTFPSSYIDAIMEHAHGSGQTVRIEDVRTDKAINCDEGVVQSLDERDQSFGAAISANATGILLCRTACERYRLTGLIGDLFRGHRIIIPASNTAKGREFQAKLMLTRNGPVGFGSGSDWKATSRITVCTLPAFAAADTPDDWPIVVIPNAFDCTTMRFWKARWQYMSSRVYAFLDSDRPMSPREQTLLKAVVGPTIWSSTSIRTAQQVTVAFAAIPSSIMRDHAEVTLEQKRKLYWNNDRRNKAVAEVAASVSRAEFTALNRFGLFLRDSSTSELPKRPRVVVLVESPEHGRQLQRQLPKWQLLQRTSPEESLHNVSTSSRDHLAGSIVTYVSAAQMKHIDADVVIVASGGEGPPLADMKIRNESGHVMLIDFDDEFCEYAEHMTGERMRSYQRAEFQVDDSIRGTSGPTSNRQQ